MTPDERTLQLIIDSLEQVKTEMRVNHDEILRLEMRIDKQLGKNNLESIDRLNELAKINTDKINGIQVVVDNKLDASQKTVTDTMRWFLGFAFGLVVLLGGVVGWTAKDHIQLKQETTALRNDFGTSLLLSPDDHNDMFGFEALKNKYFPSRGGPITNTKNSK